MNLWSRREFLGASAWTLAGAALARGSAGTQESEPIIDIHQHTEYGGKRDKNWNPTGPGRTDEQLIAHQRAMGVTRFNLWKLLVLEG